MVLVSNNATEKSRNTVIGATTHNVKCCHTSFQAHKTNAQLKIKAINDDWLTAQNCVI